MQAQKARHRMTKQYTRTTFRHTKQGTVNENCGLLRKENLGSKRKTFAQKSNTSPESKAQAQNLKAG